MSEKEKNEKKELPAVDVVEEKEILYLTAAVVGMRPDGTIDIQDAKQYFEKEVHRNLDPVTFSTIVEKLHKDMTKAALVEEIKRDLASSLIGGNK